MKLNLIYIVLVVLAFFGCAKENEKDKSNESSNEYVNFFKDEGKMKALREQVIKQGDTTAFKKLEVIYTLSGHEREFLYYAIRMAEDYNYPKAFYSVYFTMGMDVKNDNNGYRKLSRYYLLKASELGYLDAVYDVKDLYPNGNIPASKEYWKEIRR